jgi:mannose-6-phosphate isomerase-like protein (cupin superfamily)
MTPKRLGRCRSFVDEHSSRRHRKGILGGEPRKKGKAVLRKVLYAMAHTLLIGSIANANEIRRVVTTLDADNRSTTLVDGQVTLNVSGSGNRSANLWLTYSSPPGFSFAADAAKPTGLNPPNNGTVLRVVDVPPLKPEDEAKLAPELMMKRAGDNAPTRGVPVTNPLMHRTRTVDYAIIMSGEIDLMLDDKTVHLKAGDVVIQQATNHAWLNHGTEPCRIMFVLMDSKEP